MLSKGMVFNIQKYSIHDGPGIRTTVFLKGCPLNCWWCHNPESQEYNREIVFWEDRCIGCGDCEKACKSGAITAGEKGPEIDKTDCILCGRCTDACPAGALETIGKIMSAEDVMREIEKDFIFYEESGGGVTFSGGEPLVQDEFLYELLSDCRKKDIHTALDTSGYAPRKALLKVREKVDLFLYDIKHMDDSKHQRYTGVSNRIILENLKVLAQSGSSIIVRFPVIPGINDDEENISKTGKFIASLNLKDISLLPYHNTGTDKFGKLGRIYKLPDILPPPGEKMLSIKEKLKKMGLNVKIGG